jgi:hypothetical protein
MAGGPVIGNGDLGVVVGGPAEKLTFYLGKADFFGVIKGGVTAMGSLNLSIPELENASSYLLKQNVGPANITGEFASADGAKLSLKSWVAREENLLVLELKNSGSKALTISSKLFDGMGTPGNATTMQPFGISQHGVSLKVSPDIVDVELGNRLYGRTGENPGKSPPLESAFKGEIADFMIYNDALPPNTLESFRPYYEWTSAKGAKFSGSVRIDTRAPHGGSAVFDGSAASDLWLGTFLMPQRQFRLCAWIKPSAITKGKCYIAAACVDQDTVRAHGVCISLIDGKLNVTLNRTSLTAPNPIAANQWTRVAADYDGTALTLFANGQALCATKDFPGYDEVMGADRATIHFGDPQIPFDGCSPEGLVAERVLGAESKLLDGSSIFTLAPGAGATIALAAITDRNNPDYAAAAPRLIEELDAARLGELATQHAQWWNDFWLKSFVEIPDKQIENNWYASLYLLACCSKAGCPPPGLWGNFITAPQMAWNGDYTLNYNYEAPFWAAYATNHMELADNYETPLLDYMPRGRAIARKYRQQGLYYYMHIIPLPGWSNDGAGFLGQKSETLFAAVDCVMRWRYTHDLSYAKKIYPFLKGTADFWDHYLVLKDGHYVDLDDAAGENKKNDNPATSLAFLRLLYPAMIEISGDLGIDQEKVPLWKDIPARLSSLPIVPAATIDQLETGLDPHAPAPPPGQKRQNNPQLTLQDILGADVVEDRMVIRNGETGWGFVFPMVNVYHDGRQRQSGPGMSSSMAIFPGWAIGLESSEAERKAALDTVTLTAHWFDFNDQCTFYAAAALAGYDPREILGNLHELIAHYAYPNFIIEAGGGGTENFAVTPAALGAMFIQSYQKDIHVFANWPMDKDAAFGNLNACGGFLISSALKGGKIEYVKITSIAGQECGLVNPWPETDVDFSSNRRPSAVLHGVELRFPTQAGEEIVLSGRGPGNK